MTPSGKTLPRTFREVSIPPPLLQDILDQDCVLFLGAGASTEGQGTSYWHETLVDELIKECSYPPELPRELPAICQYYCENLDAKNKGRLVRFIRERIDRFMRTPPAYRTVTACHEVISSIPHLRIIITTNWDPFMERVANVLPIVRNTDLAYWNDASRQVIKMHGCITDPSTMIITTRDYVNYPSPQQLAVANKIRDLMTTKTFLFVGYSLEDRSFQTMHSDVFHVIGEFARTAYAVLPTFDEDTAVEWKRRDVLLIRALAYPFLEELRYELIHKGVLFDVQNDIFLIEDQLRDISENQDCVDQETDVGFLTAYYQDGLGHSLEELSYALRVGTTKDQIKIQEKESSGELVRYIQLDAHDEVAYWSGRCIALSWFLGDRDKPLPKYFSTARMKPFDKRQYVQEFRTERRKQPSLRSE